MNKETSIDKIIEDYDNKFHHTFLCEAHKDFLQQSLLKVKEQTKRELQKEHNDYCDELVKQHNMVLDKEIADTKRKCREDCGLQKILDKIN